MSDGVLLVSEARARTFQDEGQPVLAACCFLAHGQPKRAADELIRTHQLEVALALALSLNLPSLQPLLHMLASRAERLHEWPLAVDLLQRTRDPMAHLALLAARAVRLSVNSLAGAAPPPNVFALASLPEAASYRQLAETAQRGGNIPEAVRCYLVCGDHAAAAELALPVLSAALGGGACDLQTAHTVLDAVRQASLEDPPPHANGAGGGGGKVSFGGGAMAHPTRCALLGWSAIEGTMQAVWRGYTPILMPLLRAVDELRVAAMGTPNAPTEHELDELTMQVYAYLVRSGEDPNAANALAAQLDEHAKAGRLDQALLQAFEMHQQSGAPAMPPRVHTRPLVASGGELASSGSDRFTSYFSGQRIREPAFPLEENHHGDGVGYISLSDAVMWARVHPFSPTHSGCRLNPF